MRKLVIAVISIVLVVGIMFGAISTTNAAKPTLKPTPAPPPSSAALAQDEPVKTGLVPEATAACQDFGGLVSVYQGKEYTDAFSSVAYLGQGIVVAGKRSWNDFPPNIAIYRSTDYGLTWNTVPNPSGITGRHVYFFGQHDSRVFVGTGDEGNACLMRSDDYGATWSVVLTTADLKALAGTSDESSVKAVFTPVYMGENRWLVNLRNDETAVYLLESLDNGDTWHTFYPTGIDTSARKMILTSDGTLLYAGFMQNHGMYVSHDGGYSFAKTSDFLAFAGMADLGNGSYLAGTYYSTYESGTQPPIAISIYKSSDYGQTWNLKTTVKLPTTVGYFRTMIKVAEDLVIAYASCSEYKEDWPGRCAEAYVSRDGGETWTDLGPAFVGPYGKMNAIYDTVLVKPGTFIATAQPDSNILRSNQPPMAEAGPDQTVERTSAAGAQVTLDGSASYDPDHGPQPLSYSWTWSGGSASGVKPSALFPMGTTLVTLTVSDGQCSDTDTANVIVRDTIPPSAPNLVSPTDGKIINVNTVGLDWSDVTDPSTPVQYQVQADNNSDFSSPEYDSGWISVSNVNTSALADNVYYWRARAKDGVGNVGDWSTVWNFMVDTTPPTTSISLNPPTPDGCNGWHISPVTITLTASDSGSGVAYTQYSLDNGATWTQCPPNPLTFTINTAGTTTVQAYSVDNAGNVETPKSTTFKIDLPPPQVAMVAPPDSSTIQGTYTFAAKTTDGFLGATQVRLYIRGYNGAPLGVPIGYDNLPMTFNAGTGNWKYTLNTNSPNLPDGCYIAFGNASDIACNWSLSAPVRFIVHNWAVTQVGSLPMPPVAGVLGNYMFSVKLAPPVNPKQPNVSSMNLVVKIFATSNPGNILHTYTYAGMPSTTGYWIDPLGVYHVEFQSSMRPMQYTVAVYSNCGSLIGQYNFSTRGMFGF